MRCGSPAYGTVIGHRNIHAQKLTPMQPLFLQCCRQLSSKSQVSWLHKQHLRIKKFLGTSETVVKAKIWCAASTSVPIAIIKLIALLEDKLLRKFMPDWTLVLMRYEDIIYSLN